MVNLFTKSNALHPTELQQYFQKLRRLGELTVHDGVALARDLHGRGRERECKGSKGQPYSSPIRRILLNWAMNELGLLHPALSSMMIAVAQNESGDTLDVGAELTDFTKEDGDNIGRRLGQALTTNASSSVFAVN